jgi:hypothetical protein
MLFYLRGTDDESFSNPLATHPAHYAVRSCANGHHDQPLQLDPLGVIFQPLPTCS